MENPKHQPAKSQTNPKSEKSKDLEDRSADFAEEVRRFARLLPRTITNLEDVKQLVRASGSVAANCIEANESLGAKDRIMRFRISRKEAKECQLWLRLVYAGNEPVLDGERGRLRQEAHELKLILTTIIKRLEG